MHNPMPLPRFITDVINTLERCGFAAYLVGGSVRDFMLGHSPTDWDIATSARPCDVIKTFGNDKCIPTGIKHGTVTLIIDNHPVEITTFRIDGKYLDNRRPESIVFSKNIQEDLSRRDFTINAMAYNPKSGVLDPFGGKADLESKIIRAVGNPEKRFSEDALRMMRALRFGAKLDFAIEKNTRRAIYNCKKLLHNIAKERLQAELSKLILSDNPGLILAEFWDIFAEILECPDFCHIEWKENSKLIFRSPQNLALRLAILLDGVSKITPPHQILKSLRYDNKTIYTVKTISNYLPLEITPDPKSVKHILSVLDKDMLKLILNVKEIKQKNSAPIINIIDEIISNNQCYKQKQLAINGNDLIALGISGTEIGRMLKLLLTEVIEERCENKKSSLLKLAKALK